MTVTRLSECGKKKLKNWHVIPVLRWTQDKLSFRQAGIRDTSSLQQGFSCERSHTLPLFRGGKADVAIQNASSLRGGVADVAIQIV